MAEKSTSLSKKENEVIISVSIEYPGLNLFARPNNLKEQSYVFPVSFAHLTCLGILTLPSRCSCSWIWLRKRGRTTCPALSRDTLLFPDPRLCGQGGDGDNLQIYSTAGQSTGAFMWWLEGRSVAFRELGSAHLDVSPGCRLARHWNPPCSWSLLTSDLISGETTVTSLWSYMRF